MLPFTVFLFTFLVTFLYYYCSLALFLQASPVSGVAEILQRLVCLSQKIFWNLLNNLVCVLNRRHVTVLFVLVFDIF